MAGASSAGKQNISLVSLTINRASARPTPDAGTSPNICIERHANLEAPLNFKSSSSSFLPTTNFGTVNPVLKPFKYQCKVLIKEAITIPQELGLCYVLYKKTC
ncbi:hypothetical protein NPIL_441301 [Nephila pilipes]|uniref:Uncharacterized protein n=1 Tax=Nephila pilipes TaxID=299642 RepID=A0A8X6NYN6_NEPPI|nr:hypothetical protein NPIL_472311 [Nephila pilipes]GFT39381.1 hypothetical protein NPIL_441301 [Nephila pilipes]